MKNKKTILPKNSHMFLFGYGLVGTAYGQSCGLGCLMLFDLKPNIKRKVGDKYKDKDIHKDGKHTALFFSKTKDVDDMIKRLNKVKKAMEKEKLKSTKNRKAKQK